MSGANAYIMLMSSLPGAERLFLAKRPPLSRLKLDRRLSVLAPEDTRELKLAEQVLHWGEISINLTDREIVARAKKALKETNNETVRRLIRDRLEIRTCMAAIRRRARGEQAPKAETVWGFGRWTGHIARNWNEKAFGLDRVFPWLAEADKLYRAGDTLALQRLILAEAWKSANRLKGEHHYDFVAVVVYVLKWNILDRWSRYDGAQASVRFEELTDAALGDHTNLFAEGQT